MHCRDLRWKGYSEDLSDAAVQMIFIVNRLPYLCLQTSQPWGTDGDIAAPETCHRARSCFVAHSPKMRDNL